MLLVSIALAGAPGPTSSAPVLLDGHPLADIVPEVTLQAGSLTETQRRSAERVLRDDRLRRCYVEGLKGAPAAYLLVDLRLGVAPDGSVAAVESFVTATQEGTMAIGPSFRPCAEAALPKLTFVATGTAWVVDAHMRYMPATMMTAEEARESDLPMIVGPGD